MGARRLFAAAIVGLGLLAYAGSAQACSCVRMDSRAALREADAAVVGKLLEVLPRDAYRADYRYRVQRVYKSGRGLVAGQSILVRSNRGGAACGLPEGVGARYGLLLQANVGGPADAATAEPRWRGGLCSVLAPRQLQSAAHSGDRADAAAAAVPGCS
jgi:hypothetical protein